MTNPLRFCDFMAIFGSNSPLRSESSTTTRLRAFSALTVLGLMSSVFYGCSSDAAASFSGSSTGGGGALGVGGAQGASGGKASGVGGASIASGGSTMGGPVGGSSNLPSGGVSNSGGNAGVGGNSAQGGGSSGGAGADLPHFSFFVTSLDAMRRLSGTQDGFGGDLRYGEATGLAGADKICTEIAESAMPGSGVKQWRAFLSIAGNGTPVHARDRIGEGPWYDRLGKLVAQNKTALLMERPEGADPAIKDDLPNETGTPNHQPDLNLPEADNHHILTGSDTEGRLFLDSECAECSGDKATCLDWTSTSKNNGVVDPDNSILAGRPRIGFCWSIQNRIHWISGQSEGGCGAGVAIEPNGGSDPENPIVGSGGGYGGIYCFALTP